MKIVYYILVTVVELLLVYCIWPCDIILAIVMFTILISLAVIAAKYTGERQSKNQKDIAWGLLFGTITSILILISLFIWATLYYFYA